MSTATIPPPLQDSHGNKIVVQGDNINLHLTGNQGVRTIGILHRPERMLAVVRERSKHLHNKTQSYAFNHYILKYATKFDKVRVCEDSGYYLVPVDVILSKGKFHFHKQQGFERQLSLSLEEILKYKIDEL